MSRLDSVPDGLVEPLALPGGAHTSEEDAKDTLDKLDSTHALSTLSYVDAAAPGQQHALDHFADAVAAQNLGDMASMLSPATMSSSTTTTTTTTTAAPNVNAASTTATNAAMVKKKKPPRRATVESPNICFECKTTDSRLWRRGPDGNLMCNACGLRWRRSVKAKEAPKSTPRKRKLANADSVSPQSPQAMTLPQSSMMAAQRGGMLTAPFAGNPALYGTMPGPTQNFGQLQYQPQNMYLQQQRLHNQHHQNNHHTGDTVHRQDNKRQDPQIDPALMAEGQAQNGSRPSMQQNGQLSALPSGETAMRPSAQSLNGHGVVANSLDIQNTSTIPDIVPPQHAQTASNMTQNQSNLLSHPVNGHMTLEDSTFAALDPTALVASSDHPADHSAELLALSTNGVSQAEDFAGLLSLKAFVDDAARPF